MGVYLYGRPINEKAIHGLRQNVRIVEEEFTILHEGETTPADETHGALRKELARYKEQEREFGKAGHADFGLWEIWAEREHPLGGSSTEERSSSRECPERC